MITFNRIAIYSLFQWFYRLAPLWNLFGLVFSFSFFFSLFRSPSPRFNLSFMLIEPCSRKLKLFTITSELCCLSNWITLLLLSLCLSVSPSPSSSLLSFFFLSFSPSFSSWCWWRTICHWKKYSIHLDLKCALVHSSLSLLLHTPYWFSSHESTARQQLLSCPLFSSLLSQLLFFFFLFTL